MNFDPVSGFSPSLRSRVLALLLAGLSTVACAPAGEPLPGISQPGSESALSGRARTLRLRLAAHQALSAFNTLQASAGQAAADKGFLLCPGQIRALQTRILLAGQILPEDEKTLRGKGFEVSRVQGQSVISRSRDLSLSQLLAGLELAFELLPAGAADVRSVFYDADGAQLGFIRYSTELRAEAENRVTLTLTSDGESTGPCPTLKASLSGATLIASVGTPSSRLPSSASPAPTASPTASPSAASPKPAQPAAQPAAQPGASPGAAPGAAPADQMPDPMKMPPGPENLLIVKRTDSSITLSWSAVDGAFGYKVFVDGREMASLPPSATRYEFTGLASNSQYGLSVQALGPSGPTRPSNLLTRTRER